MDGNAATNPEPAPAPPGAPASTAGAETAAWIGIAWLLVVAASAVAVYLAGPTVAHTLDLLGR